MFTQIRNYSMLTFITKSQAKVKEDIGYNWIH